MGLGNRCFGKKGQVAPGALRAGTAPLAGPEQQGLQRQDSGKEPVWPARPEGLNWEKVMSEVTGRQASGGAWDLGSGPT